MRVSEQQVSAKMDRTTTPAVKERFRWPVIVLGIVLIPLNSLWIARAEAMDYSGFPTCASLFYNVIFSLLVLLLINIALRRFLPRIALCRRELLVVYAMLATGSSLVGHDYMQMLVPSIPHSAYFRTDGDQISKLVVPHLPHWLTITTPSETITKFEQGHASLYRWEYIQPWIVPIIAWSTFLLAVAASMLAINVILRKHWVEEERLTYPIAQIPLLITEGGGSNSIFRSKLFWIGFLFAAGLDLWNGFAQLYPAIPGINVKITDISYMFAGQRPWSAMGWTMVSFYPFVIGLSYFMPTNVAFSSWFFFFARKAQQVIAAAGGYEGTDAWYPYLKEQSYGGLIALFAATMWYGRGYLKQVFEQSRDPEASGFRWAMMVLAIGFLIMLGFLVLAGVKPWVALIYVGLYLMFCGALTRIRAELGPPAHELGYVGTSDMMVISLGSAILGPQTVAVLGLLHFQNRMHRGLLMPQQAESLKAASQSGLRIRTMVIALAIAAVVGVFSAFWAMMHLSYARVASAAWHPAAPGSGFAVEAYNKTASWLNNPMRADWGSVSGLAIGAAVTLFLARLSVMFFGFPFHPAGYALGMAFGMDYIWLPVMISWLVKVIILRYSGLRGYRTAMPLFVGLVLGEFAIGGMWSFVRGVLGVQTYTFFY